jgi:hypothetical protein
MQVRQCDMQLQLCDRTLARAASVSRCVMRAPSSCASRRRVTGSFTALPSPAAQQERQAGRVQHSWPVPMARVAGGCSTPASRGWLCREKDLSYACQPQACANVPHRRPDSLSISLSVCGLQEQHCRTCHQLLAVRSFQFPPPSQGF